MDAYLSTPDHDLLIRIDENLRNLRAEFGAMRGTLSQKAEQTEVARLETEIKAQDSRISATERLMWRALGIIGFVEVAISGAIAIHYWLRW